MKIIKSIVLWIKILKWRKDVSKYDKKFNKLSFTKTNTEDFINGLSEKERLQDKGLRLQNKLDSLK